MICRSVLDHLLEFYLSTSLATDSTRYQVLLVVLITTEYSTAVLVVGTPSSTVVL